jgi:predicted nucleic acid-binding protein
VILFDTNVLVYALDRSTAHHADSHRAVQSALAGRIPGVLLPQILLETYSILTSRRRTSNPLSPGKAWATLTQLRQRLTTYPVPADAVARLDAVLGIHPKHGAEVYELFLVAQMQSLGISDICTYNVTDFALPSIRPLEPGPALQVYGIT